MKIENYGMQWFVKYRPNQCWTGIYVVFGYQPGYQYEYENTQLVNYGLLIVLWLRPYRYGMFDSY